MANVPIVTDVTKAQLDALVAANGLNEGLQYKVTDQNWLLIATSDSTLSAAFGTLIVNNGVTVPSYVYANIIVIDSGIITSDTDITTGTPIHVVFPSGYTPIFIIIDTGVELTNIVGVEDVEENYDILIVGGLGANFFKTLKQFENFAINASGMNFYATGNTSPGFRFWCKFERLLF